MKTIKKNNNTFFKLQCSDVPPSELFFVINSFSLKITKNIQIKQNNAINSF